MTDAFNSNEIYLYAIGAQRIFDWCMNEKVDWITTIFCWCVQYRFAMHWNLCLESCDNIDHRMLSPSFAPFGLNWLWYDVEHQYVDGITDRKPRRFAISQRLRVWEVGGRGGGTQRECFSTYEICAYIVQKDKRKNTLGLVLRNTIK